MKPLYKGFIIAALHVAIVLSLGGKLLYDRATRPRIWVRTASVDPDLPIRGRYFTLSLQVKAPGMRPSGPVKASAFQFETVELSVENDKLVAHKSERNTGLRISDPWRGPTADDTYLLWPAVTFFVSEHAPNLNVKAGEELWAEVTVPLKGPPRPIQLAVKRDGKWVPLTY
ncbi:MAG TPA: hypothetical protein VE783_04260 [Candidatus Limnocylindrales bacterium]|jgi:hypothetical protein|nr:hypothetical protein [Candidatus Limnocylindrales bacterium]